MSSVRAQAHAAAAAAPRRPLARLHGGDRGAGAGGAWDARRAALAVAIGLFAASMIYGAASTPGFVTWDNAKAILASMGFVGIVAVGMTLIMLGGNLFSLSLGTTVAVTAMAFLSLLHLGLVVALLITLALGLAICAAQGAVIGAFGANPIIVTIAAGALQQGLTASLSNGHSVQPSAADGVYDVLVTPVLGIPFSVYVLLALAIVVELVLRRSRFGRELYLVGENRRAAFAAGLSVTRVTTVAFALAGVCTAIAGVLIGAFNQNASLLLSGTYTYDAISAAIVGGNAIGGGRGSAARTLLGALVIATVGDLMLLRNYSTGAQILVKGLIVLVFVALLNARAPRGTR